MNKLRLVLLGVALAASVSCALTLAQEKAIEASFAAACPLETLIPSVGSLVVAACPGEEAILAAALDYARQQEAASAPADSTATVELYRVRGGHRLPSGHAPVRYAASMQTYLDQHGAP